MPVIPSTWSQVNLKFTGTGAPTGAETTFGVSNAGVAAPATVEAAVFTAWNARLKQRTNSKLTLGSILVKNGPNATGAFAEVSHGTVGTSVAAMESPQVVFNITKVTLRGGRAGKGRWLYPGVAEADCDEAGVVDGATITAWNTQLALFISDLSTAGFAVALLHNDPTKTPDLVTAMTMGSKVATLKPRLRRR